MKHFDFYNKIKSFTDFEKVSFHMPGHKGKIGDIPSHLDVTELKDTDNLYDPEDGGVIDTSLSELKRIYNTNATVVLTGGSTLALNAAIHAVMRKSGKKKMLSERKVHRSVVYSFARCGIEPVWIYQAIGNKDVTSEEIIGAIEDNSDCAAVIITSPDYYGYMHNIREIAVAAQKHGMCVIVDSAHGAHLDFWKNGDNSAVNIPNTLVAQSLHKTLPALTGAALVHSNTDITRDELLASARMFSTTSPSYLISESAFDAVFYMHECGEEALEHLLVLIDNAKKELSDIGFSFANFELTDPFRITLTSEFIGFTERLYEFLYNNGIVCEFYDSNSLVIIPSVMNTENDFSEFISVMSKFDSSINLAGKETNVCMPKPQITTSMTAAIDKNFVTVDVSDALNRIVAEPITLYPPGTAILVPGEVIDADMIKYLKTIGISKVKVTE